MVLYAIGPDRPGLVSRFSSVIHNNGGNFEDSRMATLAGDFALIVLFSADDDKMEEIRNECKKIEDELSVSCHFRKPGHKAAEQSAAIWKFEATGHDQPGIVSRLSTAMATMGVSVIAMDTSVINMAFIGTPMFKVSGQISIPETIESATLRDTLEDVCEDMALVMEFTRQV